MEGEQKRGGESKRGAERTYEGGTMEGGKLTNKASMLLKNRAMEQAVWVDAIARRRLEPGPEAQILVGSAKKRTKKGKQSQHIT